MKYDMIMAILPKGDADRIMIEAKHAGARGGTIILARGTGSHEAKTFFGLTIESGREILMIMCNSEDTDIILEAIIREGNLNERGAGIAFVLEAKKVVGLEHRAGIEIGD